MAGRGVLAGASHDRTHVHRHVVLKPQLVARQSSLPAGPRRRLLTQGIGGTGPLREGRPGRGRCGSLGPDTLSGPHLVRNRPEATSRR